MSQENVEIVRRVIDVMDAEGFEAALPVFLDAAHPDVEWQEDPDWPGSAAYRGVEQVRQVILDRMDTLVSGIPKQAGGPRSRGAVGVGVALVFLTFRPVV
jgi:ketosteroid isomerase-like protein